MQRVVFLDRDGVINRYPGNREYVKSEEEFVLLPGVVEAIARLKDAGYKVIVISNQAGVGKGLYTEDDLRKMNRKLKEAGADIDGVYYCIHTDDDNCSCRKPEPGLIHKAQDDLRTQIDVVNSFFIGDSSRDMVAAYRAGYKGILVLSGRSNGEDVDTWPVKPTAVLRDLPEAVDWILKECI